MRAVPIDQAPEIPWRPGYRNFILAGKEQGVTCVAAVHVIEPGKGAPLHLHRGADEIFILLEGALDMRIGEADLRVEANQCIAIPAGVPHRFTAVGPGPVRMFAFMPQSGNFADTAVYLEGEPPAATRG
jgi:mannose-6-phosphate isomerase-like protein (cupin superfamily)